MHAATIAGRFPLWRNDAQESAGAGGKGGAGYDGDKMQKNENENTQSKTDLSNTNRIRTYFPETWLWTDSIIRYSI